MAGYMQKLRDQLNRKREKLMKRPIGVVSAFVLGSGSQGAPKCLYLHTDHDRYLFNAGEGSQRLAQELKLKLRRVRNIFISHESWEKLAGLPGIAMALRDVGASDINIYGPSDVGYVFNETSNFVRLQGMRVNSISCETGANFQDAAIRVICVPIASASGDRAVCYVVLPKERRPELVPDLCKDRNIPPGPLYATLKSGGQIEIDGKIITSGEVTRPATPPVNMMVIDAPNADFIPSLEGSQILSEHAAATSMVFHFTPISVMAEPSYKRWMSEKAPNAAHILVNEAAAYGTGGVSAVQQLFLNQLLPDAFPLLAVPSILQLDTDHGDPDPSPVVGFSDDPPAGSATETWRHNFGNADKLVAARPLLEYRLTPPKKFNISRCPVLNVPVEISKINSKISQAARSSVQRLRQQGGRGLSDYPSILFTGTGGAVPAPMRNTAGILIELNDNTVILFDCAEGTLGQLIRLLGPQRTSQTLSKLSAIFVSHPHADHTLGLPSILLARSKIKQSSPVKIVAPPETNRWLMSCARRRFLPQNSFETYDNDSLNRSSSLREILGVMDAEMVEVDHSPYAYAIAINYGGEKITYSGDTAPNEGLVRIGTNSNILINEATLGTVLPGLARKKRHCTTADALDLARRMMAKNTILTHFSTRYARIPQLLDLQNVTNTIIAFDNMLVRPSLLHVLPNIIQPLSEIYRERLQKIRRKERRQF